ncbi:unnamed protein product [Kuraishia capsulata CBS 1993]|uniref:TrmE-type G domain-containing protein n=1 Tax=Kuraishia capsulata CBS 1993 TaxID=1382522 RepID=W6MJB1_9ASCO|nr:uncharacterized protein KUCA_T00002014001 [Kuraishia capsulata CBS 1993]CDK26043.1 unnamed protein product [Kuraishia capsulata CBS 1993]
MRSFLGVRFLSNSATEYVRPTIYALSTRPGRAAIGVIRISGPASTNVFKALTGKTIAPKHRASSLRKLVSPKTGVLLDHALTLFFRGPKSYTGEDLLELHVHGGTAVIEGVLKAIENLHTPYQPIRHAEKGEFSKRAFQNGRFDLTELEGINSLIHAETESQRLMSLRSMEGETNALFSRWRTDIVNNVALLTTIIDFGEEHGVEETDEIFQTVRNNVLDLQREVSEYIARLDRSEILLRGIQAVLLGPPNAGKSSLLNVISNSNTAIVSDIAGTTRDIINVPLDISGYKVVIGDAAGIRSLNDADQIEAEGIKRAMAKSATADLVLVIVPVDDLEVDDEFVNHIKQMSKRGKRILVVINKSDLLVNNADLERVLTELQSKLGLPSKDFTAVSCSTGVGVDNLLSTLTQEFKSLTWYEDQDPVSISDRAKDILVKDVLYGFEEFLLFSESNDVVLAGETLRYSIEGIGKITGEAVGIEEILGVVFSSFCIGK